MNLSILPPDLTPPDDADGRSRDRGIADPRPMNQRLDDPAATGRSECVCVKLQHVIVIGRWVAVTIARIVRNPHRHENRRLDSPGREPIGDRPP
jgi:hypothetical protein